jgi:hypothetical protein
LPIESEFSYACKRPRQRPGLVSIESTREERPRGETHRPKLPAFADLHDDNVTLLEALSRPPPRLPRVRTLTRRRSPTSQLADDRSIRLGGILVVGLVRVLVVVIAREIVVAVLERPTRPSCSSDLGAQPPFKAK